MGMTLIKSQLERPPQLAAQQNMCYKPYCFDFLRAHGNAWLKHKNKVACIKIVSLQCLTCKLVLQL